MVKAVYFVREQGLGRCFLDKCAICDGEERPRAEGAGARHERGGLLKDLGVLSDEALEDGL